MDVYGSFAFLSWLLLQKVVPCTSLCDNNKDTVCQIDEGLTIGIVIGCVVALLLIGFVVLLSCSYLKMPRDHDSDVENQDVAAISHVSTGHNPQHLPTINNGHAYTYRRNENGSTTITINNNIDQTDRSRYLGVYVAQQDGGRQV